jgi:L-alanine-DL-glutamate epimerase-like enolase superfamily enzyme
VILSHRHFELELAHPWTTARGLRTRNPGTHLFRIVFVELRSPDGSLGRGEAAPITRYAENVDSVCEFLERVDAARLSFDDVQASMAYLEGVRPGNQAPKCALNLALLDGAAHRMGRSVCEHLGLGFAENHHLTSFSIGIDEPSMIRRKVEEAAPYPILKLKVGSPNDRENLAALRDIAPTKRVRVDANEGWSSREEALRQIEWLATDPNVEFVEQPMPAQSNPRDLAWLKARSPLPLMADESFRSAADASLCADAYHAVNVKLVKTGGITGAHAALTAARAQGLKTMIGCMVESSVLITAAAHLAELADYLDIDGNLLVTNDPFLGATSHHGRISFAHAPCPTGLRVAPRPPRL